MYIKCVTLQNVCCFEDVTFAFEQPSDDGHLVVILGDNGVGKTTLLRSIAMGLCGETSASALLRELYGDFVRYQSKEGTARIRIEFTKTQDGTSPWIETTVTRSPSGNTEVHQNTHPADGFPWNELFVCGYGAMRGGLEHQDIVEYATVDSVYTLFNSGASLQNPELVLRRFGGPKEWEPVLRAIDRILLFPEGSTQLHRQGLLVNRQWIEDIPIGGWGDGHRVTMSLLADLIGWATLFDQDMLATKVSGVVLIDEMEQHLHPSWQRQILSLLRQQFPAVQFIVTTHSPLCVVGTTSLKDEESDLFVLARTDDRVEPHVVRHPPRGLRADQVLTSHLFGLPTSGDDMTKEEIERFSQLSQKLDRSGPEEDELQAIRQSLDQKLGSGESALERHVAAAVRKVLEGSRVADQLPKDALDYELRRQLAELLHG